MSIESAHSAGLIGLAMFASCAISYTVAAQAIRKSSSNYNNNNNNNNRVPIAANYHFTRKCNYKCGFCFHTAKNSFVLPLEEAKKVLRELRDLGCRKINFAGGEPFLPDYTTKKNRVTDLGEMVKYAKETCKFESVSIISNGRFIDEAWMEKYHCYLDVLGVSCDSTNEATNTSIGRGITKAVGGNDHVSYVKRAAALCFKYGIPFKLNTVVNRFNWQEDMSELIRTTRPMRWKIFQVLPLEGENVGVGAKNQVEPFLISSAQFDAYVQRHRRLVPDPDILKVEDNLTMQASYVLVDEHGRFLDSSTGGKVPTKSILDVGGAAAWSELCCSEGGGFDERSFEQRDGLFFEAMGFAGTASTGSSSGCSSCASASASAEAPADIEDLV